MYSHLNTFFIQITNYCSFRSVSSARPETDTSLPPVLHMTWLGSPLPPKFAPNILSYVSLNPDHELWLWLDTSPDTVNIGHKQIRVRDVNKETWTTRDMLESCTNFAMKSDILRLEILYKYGGIYLDIDSIALRSFGILIMFIQTQDQGLNCFKDHYSIMPFCRIDLSTGRGMMRTM